jgi:hypothetical protein
MQSHTQYPRSTYQHLHRTKQAVHTNQQHKGNAASAALPSNTTLTERTCIYRHYRLQAHASHQTMSLAVPTPYPPVPVLEPAGTDFLIKPCYATSALLQRTAQGAPTQRIQNARRSPAVATCILPQDTGTHCATQCCTQYPPSTR